MWQYIPIPPVLPCTGIDMYHDVFANGNMQIQTIIHTNTTPTFPPLGSNRTRIGMFCCMYLPVLVRIWYVLVCIFFRFDTRVWGEHRWYWVRICTYFGMYWPVYCEFAYAQHVLVCIAVVGIVYARIHTMLFHTYQFTRVPKHTRPPVSAPRALMGQLSFLYALSAVGNTAPESGRPKEARLRAATMNVASL